MAGSQAMAALLDSIVSGNEAGSFSRRSLNERAAGVPRERRNTTDSLNEVGDPVTGQLSQRAAIKQTQPARKPGQTRASETADRPIERASR